MSDHEPTSTPAEEQAAAPARPARRRRSASRPAGPPEGAAAQAAEAAPAEPAPAEAAPAEPAPVEAAPAEPAPAEAAPAAAEPAAEAPAKPARRRRAASRPAGRPAAETPAAETPAPESAPTTPDPETQLGADAPLVVEEVVPPRRRGTRKRAAAKPEPSPQETAPLTPETTQVVGNPEAAAAEQAPTEQAATEQAGTEQVATGQAPTDAVAAEPELAAGSRRRGRRSRPTGTVAAPFDVPQETPSAQSGDDISAAVRAVFDQAAATTRSAPEDAEQDPEDELTTEEESAEPRASEDESDVAPGDDDTTDDATEEPAAAEQTEDSEDSEDEQDEDSEDGDNGGRSSSRRRRRRGGRRRRRGGGADDNGEDDSDGTAETEDAAGAEGEPEQGQDGEDEDAASAEDEQNGSESGTRRRRRRRRRRGEETSVSEDDPSDTVVRVREPRRSSREKASDQITGIDGSTRLEAKRQRRREGRQNSRRRTPILSEAEFLARREAVERTMIIRQRDDLSQLAVLEDGILVEHYVDRESATSLIGNVYLGRVQNVLPSMEAAFVDIGRGRNAVLYAGEVDWDAHGADKQGRQIEKVLKSGQTVLVQVTKDPVGAKGARLTNHVSIPGRYIVYSPGGHLSGISRKLPENERKRLKTILSDLVPDEASVIVRTAAEGASEEELVRDVNRLKAQWEAIEKKIKSGSAPQLLHAEPDLTLRIVRDLFTEDFQRLVVDGNGLGGDAFETVQSYVSHVAPHLADRLERWDREANGDVFAAHRLDEQIAKALDRKVFLPSGGSLIIDRTEAMTVIDVNTGKFTGSGGNLETTVTSNNLEAAEEIVRQLRLRDIGGIIVIDFIDMVLPSNRELLLRRLVECLGRDRTRHQVAEVTSLGLVQMTRKKIGTGLAEAFTETCEHCDGLGYHVHDMPVDTQSQADGGERQGRRGRSARNKGGGGRNAGRKEGAKEAAREPEEPVKRHGGPQDVIAAMLAKGDDAGPGEAADQPAAAEQSAEQQPVEQAPAEQAPVEQQPVELPVPAEPAPADEQAAEPAEQAPADEQGVESAPVEDQAVETAPLQQQPVEPAPPAQPEEPSAPVQEQDEAEEARTPR
ncbi:Rne/Rng family ribonuclease [Auraticoccus cholistanensis]|uniref:Rne/Rng family ribonuclease n=1 Tax=Auraticoccus cholistanensis TaxID=2656650 RepID=UPI0018D2496A|nr:Rne/Rng family ribonuclease [Auraticoccus cholistanensis]